MRGWVLASDEQGAQIGLVPNNYIEIIGRRNVANERQLEQAFAGANRLVE